MLNSTVTLASSFADHTATPSYWSLVNHISTTHAEFNIVEKLWAAWYAYMENDVLATGIMSFVLHELVYFGRSLPWIIIDQIPYFRRYKIQHSKLPSNAEQWACIKLVIMTHFTAELPQIWLFHPLATYCGLDTSLPFPSIFTMAYQVAIFFVLEDTWHYFMHRTLHTGPLYRLVHKTHHRFSAPFGLAAEYASPIEVALLGFGTLLPPIFWCAITKDLHILTMYIFIALRLSQAVDAHSGYDFPWSLRHFLPFWAGADHHDLHHERFQGNFASSFRWWDHLMGTEYKPETLKTRAEARKARLEKKVD